MAGHQTLPKNIYNALYSKKGCDVPIKKRMEMVLLNTRRKNLRNIEKSEQVSNQQSYRRDITMNRQGYRCKVCRKRGREECHITK